ncbi:hypothetical protein F4859DRAFT_510838 [Xylaria cf. heliscus]|nr:hypothetical protein F4859DRAFT_510838 [Xylaria cf. heliscus]
MGSHRDNAHFSRAGWKKRVMVPCWIIQILILLSVIGLFSYRLSHTVATWKEEESNGGVPVVEFVWEIANIAFSLISLLVTFISVARFIAEVLTPLPLLFGSILNVVLSSVVLALDIVIYVQRKDKQYSLIGLGLDAGLILFTIIPLIYAVIIYRRLLNYDDYHLPGNHKAFGFSSPEEGIEDRSSLYLNPPTPYDPTNPPPLGVTTTITSTEPQTRGRSVSIGSHRISLSFSRNASVSPHPSPPLDVAQERRTSYDHKRDTQFEDYLARRASQNSLHQRRDSYYEGGSSFQSDVKRALGDEFGFGFGDLPAPADPGKTNARGDVISAGAVAAGHAARPRVSSIGRQVSYEAIVGGGGLGTNGGGGGGGGVGMNGSGPIVTITTPPEEEVLQRGHSLNSVPEAHEEEDHHHHHQAVADGRNARKRAASESQQALLGNGSGGRRSPPRIGRIEGLEDVELENRKRRRDS